MYSRSPLQPYDPIIAQEGSRNFNYLQNNFSGAGQDSYTRPFAQSQELFQSLQNVMPTQQSTFRLRYGTSLFNNSLGIGAVQRLYSYQNINANTRKLIAVAGTAISSLDENGTSPSSILTTNGTNARLAVSRDYALIPAATSPTTWPSGQIGAGKKWHSVQGLSDWGIAQPPTAVNVASTAVAGNITLISTVGRVYAGAYRNSITGHYSNVNIGLGSFASGVSGPLFPTTESQTSTGAISWTSTGNINANDSVYATVALPINPGGNSELLKATGFGFSIPSTATVYGILVTINHRASLGSGNPGLIVTDSQATLLKAGVPVGSDMSDTFTPWGPNNAANTVNYGGSSVLWGATWTPADINNATFGFGISCIMDGIGLGSGSNTVGIDYVTITVTYATGAGANTGALTSKQVTINLPVANPPAGVDRFSVLATLDGGDINTLYVLDEVPIAQTTYVDNTPDNVLVTKNIATQTDDFGIVHGVIDNDLPDPALQFPTKHRGRIYGSVGETLFYSKSLDEVTTATGLVLGRFEEAWPATNAFDVSTQKETIRGLLSDGSTLYIGTERHMWRLDGDGPLNFSKPEVIYNEVGVMNQDAWQICYLEGQPVGMIWLTPDFRVIMGNFANYKDIGTPIQDVLNNINPTTPTVHWSQYFSQQGFDLMILAIATGVNTVPDTLCVYDLRAGRWYIWNCADSFTAGLFNINASAVSQWIVAANSGALYQFLPTATQDRVGNTPVAITSQIKTSWLNLGRPVERKSLNEIEVITGDSTIQVSVTGASKFSQTTAPNPVVTNVVPTLSPFGYLKIYLADKIALDHNYQLTFTSTNGTVDVLQGYAIEAVPMGSF